MANDHNNSGHRITDENGRRDLDHTAGMARSDTINNLVDIYLGKARCSSAHGVILVSYGQTNIYRLDPGHNFIFLF